GMPFFLPVAAIFSLFSAGRSIYVTRTRKRTCRWPAPRPIEMWLCNDVTRDFRPSLKQGGDLEVTMVHVVVGGHSPTRLRQLPIQSSPDTRQSSMGGLNA